MKQIFSVGVLDLIIGTAYITPYCVGAEIACQFAFGKFKLILFTNKPIKF